jgi:hypothetical protein
MNALKYFVIIFILNSFTMNAQSGWVKQKGKYFTKLDYTTLKSKNYYNPLGEKLTTNAFVQNSFNFYGEYGLNDKFTLVANMPLLRTNSFETTEKVSGIGDVKLDLRYGILQNSIPIAFSLGVEVPTGKNNAFAKSLDDPNSTINLPIGDGEFNINSSVAISKSIGIGYISAFGLYNYRTTYQSLKFRDLYQFGVELGVNPLKNLWLNGKIRGQFSTGESNFPSLGFVRGDATTYTITSFEAFYKFTDKIGVSFTYLTGGSSISKLKNIYASPYFSMGIVYEKK